MILAALFCKTCRLDIIGVLGGNNSKHSISNSKDYLKLWRQIWQSTIHLVYPRVVSTHEIVYPRKMVLVRAEFLDTKLVVFTLPKASRANTSKLNMQKL